MQYWMQQDQLRGQLGKWVRQMGGNTADVEDVFQDAICHLILNVRRGNYKGDSSLNTYFTSIARNIWLQKFRRDQKWKEIKEKLPNSPGLSESPEQIFLLGEKKELLNSLAAKTGEKCRAVLSLWSLNYSMQEIAEKLGYKSDGVVRKKKHQCLQKLMQLLKQNPSWKTLLQVHSKGDNS